MVWEKKLEVTNPENFPIICHVSEVSEEIHDIAFLFTRIYQKTRAQFPDAAKSRFESILDPTVVQEMFKCENVNFKKLLKALEIKKEDLSSRFLNCHCICV